MQHAKVRELLSNIHNKVLMSSEAIKPDDIPLDKLGLEEQQLDYADHLLDESPWLASVYVDFAGRSVNPVTDFIVDSYLTHLGVL